MADLAVTFKSLAGAVADVDEPVAAAYKTVPAGQIKVTLTSIPSPLFIPDIAPAATKAAAEPEVIPVISQLEPHMSVPLPHKDVQLSEEAPVEIKSQEITVASNVVDAGDLLSAAKETTVRAAATANASHKARKGKRPSPLK